MNSIKFNFVVNVNETVYDSSVYKALVSDQAFRKNKFEPHTFDAADQPLVVRGIALSSINEPGLLIYNYRLFKEDVC